MLKDWIMKEKRVRVLYIAGMGRSGSTILERSIGQFEEFVSVGELRFFWSKQPNSELCGCGTSFQLCPFWKSVISNAYGEFDRSHFFHIRELQKKVEKSYFLPRMLINLGLGFDRKIEEYNSYYLELLTAIKSVSNAQVIIDSSKDLRTLFSIKRKKEIDLTVIHLVRNPRGVAFSWTKTKKRPDVIDQDVYMHTYSPAIVTWRWLYKNLFLSITSRLFNKYIKVNYEDFISNPIGILKLILSVLDVQSGSFEFINGDKVSLTRKTHSVSGNPNRFTRGVVQLKMDNSWKNHMPQITRKIIGLFTWPLELFYRINQHDLILTEIDNARKKKW